MKERVRNALAALIKDYGLSDKALSELAEQAAAGLASDAADEVVQERANFFANIARSMQGEVTRKVQAAKNARRERPRDEEPDGEDGGGDDFRLSNRALEEMRKQSQLMREQMDALLEKFKRQEEAEAEKTALERRRGIVLEAARKVGVSEGRLKFIDTSGVKTAEDAEKLLSEYRQAEVNDNLPPKGAGGRLASSEEADKEDAKAWAKRLPDRKK